MKPEASDIQRIKSILESLLIVAAEPVTSEEFKKTLEGTWEITSKDIDQWIGELKAQYKGETRGWQITEIAGKYQLCTESQNADWVKKFLEIKNAEGLSKPALETLAIIAYRQPITKLEIEGIRGVNIDGMLKKLLDKGLVKTRGRKEILGHPFLYVTTEKFLEYFGLRSLDDLPQKEELKIVSPKPEREKSDETTNASTEDRPAGSAAG